LLVVTIDLTIFSNIANPLLLLGLSPRNVGRFAKATLNVAVRKHSNGMLAAFHVGYEQQRLPRNRHNFSVFIENSFLKIRCRATPPPLKFDQRQIPKKQHCELQRSQRRLGEGERAPIH
jgi:hypothetical protein